MYCKIPFIVIIIASYEYLLESGYANFDSLYDVAYSTGMVKGIMKGIRKLKVRTVGV